MPWKIPMFNRSNEINCSPSTWHSSTAQKQILSVSLHTGNFSSLEQINAHSVFDCCFVIFVKFSQRGRPARLVNGTAMKTVLVFVHRGNSPTSSSNVRWKRFIFLTVIFLTLRNMIYDEIQCNISNSTALYLELSLFDYPLMSKFMSNKNPNFWKTYTAQLNLFSFLFTLSQTKCFWSLTSTRYYLHVIFLKNGRPQH